MKWFFLLLLIIGSGLVSANIGGIIGLDLNLEVVDYYTQDEVDNLINESTAFVNSTDWWITNLGAMYGVQGGQFDNDNGLLTLDSNYIDDHWLALDGTNSPAADINWGGNSITNINSLYMNTTPVIQTVEEGLIQWNENDGTLNIGLGGGTVNLQVGQEQVTRVRNNLGYKVTNGKVVYITGSQGEIPTIGLANVTDSDTINILGIVTENISDGFNGYVTRYGLVRDFDTTSWEVGDKLYLSSNGDMINTHPPMSNAATIIVGFVIKKAEEDGIILVNPEMFSLGNNFNGTLRSSIINKNESGASGFTAVNDLGFYTTFGISGSENAGFGNSTSVYYAPGYGEHWTAIDGNKSFVWFADPEDRHNNGALEYEIMKLYPNGNLNVNGAISSNDWSNISIFDLYDVDDSANNLDFLQWNQSGLAWQPVSLETIYYNATSLQMVTGTNASGINVTQHPDGDHDGVTLNLTERVSAPALDARINFTDGITRFNNGIMRYKTDIQPATSSFPLIQLWNYADAAWEDQATLVESPSFSLIEQGIFDDENHVQNGVVQMRLYKSGTGNTNNEYQIDWLAIAKGFGTPVGDEVDPFAIHKDGTTPWAGNENGNGYNSSDWRLLESNELIITNATQDYKITGRGGTMAFQSQGEDQYTAYGFYTEDGLGVYGNDVILWGKGAPTDITNRERMIWRYPGGGGDFQLYTEASGTGTERRISLYTEGNNGQLILNTDGSNSMSGDLYSSGYVVNNSLGRGYYIINDPVNTLFPLMMNTAENSTSYLRIGGNGFDNSINGCLQLENNRNLTYRGNNQRSLICQSDGETTFTSYKSGSGVATPFMLSPNNVDTLKLNTNGNVDILNGDLDMNSNDITGVYYIKDIYGTTFFDLDSYVINDYSGIDVINMASRYLYASDGSDIILDFSSSGVADFKDNDVETTGDYYNNGNQGWTGTFTNGDGDTVYVDGGIITDVVAPIP